MNKKTLLLPMLLMLVTGALGLEAYRTSLLFQQPTATTYPSSVQPGDEGVYIELQLTNNFKYSYENITTRLELQEPFEGVKTENFIREIRPNAQKTVFYKVNVGPDAEPGEYLLNNYLTYSYTDIDEYGNLQTYTINTKKTVAITIQPSQKLEITSLGFEPVEIIPGQETQLKASIKNTGSVAVNDVEVSYSGYSTSKTTVSTSGATTTTAINFVPTETTKKQIASIQPSETKEISFKISSIRETEVKAYQMPVTVSYGGQTITENAVINVKGKPDLRLAGIQIDKENIYQGQTFSLSVQIENIGTGDAKSVKMEITSDNVTGSKVSYIGTIDKDDTGTAIFDLKDFNPGEHQLTLKTTYEDEYGNTQPPLESKTEYTVNRLPPDYTGIIIAVIVVIGIIYYIYRRYKRKKELEELVK